MMYPNSELSTILLPEMGSANIYFVKDLNVTINLYECDCRRREPSGKKKPSKPTFADQCSTYDDLVNSVHDRIASNHGGTLEDIKTIDRYKKEFKRACFDILDEKSNKKRKEQSKSTGFFTTIKKKLTGAWDKVFGGKI